MSSTPEQLRGIERRIIDTVSNVAVNTRLPSQVHVLIKDRELGKKYGAFVSIEYQGEGIRVTRTTIGELNEGITALVVANLLIKHEPTTPLLCDESVMDELSVASLISEGHYRLVMGEAGILEVYIPLKSRPLPSAPDGSCGGAEFLE